MTFPRSSTTTLISAMRILSRDIISGGGVANAAIAEAADRLEEFLPVLELAEQLPRDLNSDWKDTNHYELTSGTADNYWWLMAGDGIEDIDGNPCETEDGKRLGLIMDIAAAVARLQESP